MLSPVTRTVHVDHRMGAVHTLAATCALAPGDAIDLHVHAYEEFVHLTAGRLVVTLGAQAVELGPGDGVLAGVGEPHALFNAGDTPATWFELQTPQPRPSAADAYTVDLDGSATRSAAPLDPDDPRDRAFSRRDHPTTGPDLSIPGIRVRMLLDERHGATAGRMFLVEYAPGAVLPAHDHPFEETFFMLDGEVTLEVESRRRVLRPGDVGFAGVGCAHSFVNRSDAVCRWVETQAPLPPAVHHTRSAFAWIALAQKVSTTRPRA